MKDFYYDYMSIIHKEYTFFKSESVILVEKIP